MILIAILVFMVLAAGLGFAIAAILMLLWNVVVPYFGGPPITFWVTYAAYWLLILVGGLLRSSFSYKSK